jgi:predicted nucleic acid-binding Zn ribbon protein
MFCNKCGSPIRPGASFCASCGAPVDKPEREGSSGHRMMAILIPLVLLLVVGIALFAVFVIVPWAKGPCIDVDEVSAVLEGVGPEILEVRVDGDSLEVTFEQPDYDTYDLAILYLSMFDLSQYAAPEGKSVTLINASEGLPLIRTTASNQDTVAWRDGEITTQYYIGSWKVEASE